MIIDRTKAPEFVKPEYFPLQQAESVVLNGGIPFHYLNCGNQEILRLEIIFQAGKWYEQKNGVSVLAGKLLTEGGTEKYSSFEISKIFEQNGAFFEIQPGFDFVNFSIYSLSKNLYKLLDIIEDVLLRPSFSEQEVVTQRSIQIQNLKVNKEKNSFLASRLFRNRIFGDYHPYGKITDTDDIESIERDDLEDFFDSHLKNNFEVVVSGRFTTNELSLLKNFFGNIKKKRSEEFHFTTPKVYENYMLDKSESLQSSIRIGKPTIGKQDEDYPTLLIFNEILGGYFGSRLMQNLREDKGLTYGVHSSIVSQIRSTYFIISTDVIRERKADAVKEIHYEISKLVELKTDLQELNTVKNYFKGTFLSSIDSPFSLADKFKGIHFHGLTYDYYKRLFESIDRVDADAIQNFARENFAQNDLIEVLIG